MSAGTKSFHNFSAVEINLLPPPAGGALVHLLLRPARLSCHLRSCQDCWLFVHTQHRNRPMKSALLVTAALLGPAAGADLAQRTRTTGAKPTKNERRVESLQRIRTAPRSLKIHTNEDHALHSNDLEAAAFDLEGMSVRESELAVEGAGEGEGGSAGESGGGPPLGGKAAKGPPKGGPPGEKPPGKAGPSTPASAPGAGLESASELVSELAAEPAAEPASDAGEEAGDGSGGSLVGPSGGEDGLAFTSDKDEGDDGDAEDPDFNSQKQAENAACAKSTAVSVVGGALLMAAM